MAVGKTPKQTGKQAETSATKQKPKGVDIYTKMIRLLFALFAIAAMAVVGYFSYQSHQDYVDPSKVYGDWIEIGAPPYQTDILNFSEQGVSRNRRLISTQYEFDGKEITFTTGTGTTVYKLAGNVRSPQIRRVWPDLPAQSFVKKGYEHTITTTSGGLGQKRRASLAEHFKP